MINRILGIVLPSRKVTAASGGAALAGAIVAALGGIVPMDDSTAATLVLLLDMAIGAGLAGLGALVSGYFVRDNSDDTRG